MQIDIKRVPVTEDEFKLIQRFRQIDWYQQQEILNMASRLLRHQQASKKDNS